ncbi:hypothetical protein YK48G_10110 [Lentilactobacillus fungorum]|uniref:Uncharacterized protein n=1 Tax=Lentilactobacillus fungorum TaxID=2201250 RepID=A0ABQ3VZX4_9LACO|nr:hypothetical protein [Lentilactobacillus fungorum]GHP13586.1 hypothetical protein YK48G_10110 [Lentilactobacillus fungorum]
MNKGLRRLVMGVIATTAIVAGFILVNGKQAQAANTQNYLTVRVNDTQGHQLKADQKVLTGVKNVQSPDITVPGYAENDIHSVSISAWPGMYFGNVSRVDCMVNPEDPKTIYSGVDGQDDATEIPEGLTAASYMLVLWQI